MDYNNQGVSPPLIIQILERGYRQYHLPAAEQDLLKAETFVYETNDEEIVDYFMEHDLEEDEFPNPNIPEREL